MGIRSALSTVARAGKLGRIAIAARRVTKADDADRASARSALARLLADARGVPLKVGQFLGTMSQDNEFSELARQVEPRPWSLMRSVLEDSLGRSIREVFTAIDPVGIGASLGQVHRGVLKDGTSVAIKIRYPDIAKAVHSEMQIAGMLPGYGPARKWGFDLADYKAALKSNMDRELDYCGERERQERFAQRVSVDGLIVPRVYPHLSGQSVLVQSWEDGEHLDRAAQWPLADRQALAATLLRTFFTSLFVAGEIHADPHLGNLLARRTMGQNPQIILLDYGCTLQLKAPARLALLKLIMGARRHDATDPLACLVAMGFDEAKLDFVASTLPAMATLLFEPFLSDAPFHIQHWHLSTRMNQLLGDKRWWFRSAGPSDVFFLVRAFAGLIQQLSLLQISLPWWELLVDVIPQALFDQAQAFDCSCGVATPRQPHRFEGLAHLLRIRVMEAGEQVVAASFPASQTVRLAALIPEDVLRKIAAANLDLDQIVRQACDNGLVPQALFNLNVNQRTYSVWLE